MNRDFDPLERIVGQELRELPPLKAPASLSKSVLAKIHAAPQVPWWQQSVWSWPMPARIAFLIIATTLFLLACGGNWFAAEDAQNSWRVGAQKLSTLATLGNGLMVLLGSLGAIWQTYVAPWVPYIAGAAAAAYLFCLGVGTAFVRYTLKQS
jgi:hypothetical protein